MSAVNLSIAAIVAGTWLSLSLGYHGNNKVYLATKGEIVNEEPFKRHLGLFTYYSYVRHDTSRVCSSVAPHLIFMTERSVSLKPVEFVFE